MCPMKHLLGVDPGGTKCDAVLVAPDGSALGWSCFAQHRITGRHISAITTACERVLRDYDAKELCVASSRRSPLDLFGTGKYFDVDAEHMRISEYQAALALADEDYGIVVIAGTGTYVHLFAEDGLSVPMDGAGPLTGDFGSGFWIGLNALRAATRSRMHERHSTTLYRAIIEKLSRNELKRIAFFDISSNDRMTIAALAEVVDEQAEAGDKISCDILRRAAGELAETVFETLDNNGLLCSNLKLLGSGGVVCKSDIVWNTLVDKVRVFAPGLQFVRLSKFPAVIGVALAGAKRIMVEPDYKKYRERLLNTFLCLRSQ